MESNSNLKKTIFHPRHIEAGARMAPFGGYDMPIQYTGIIQEHMNTRQNVSIFDTCHMGEFLLKGSSINEDLEKLLSCSISKIPAGRCKYGFICSEDGCVIDDMLAYRIDDHEFYMVVNASTQQNDFEWIKSHLSEGSSITSLSEETVKIDIQGPESARIVEKITDQTIEGMVFYSWRKNSINGTEVLISRTGYTGEIGFEIYCKPELAFHVWDNAVSLGAALAGLGARDTLRLEMGMPLYGHELSAERNAGESGFTMALKQDAPFIGSDSIFPLERHSSKLSAIELEGRRAAREGDIIVDGEGAKIGSVTSGCFSPSLKKAIALGYILKEKAGQGSPCFIEKGSKKLKGQITALPFYKEATGRKKLDKYL